MTFTPIRCRMFGHKWACMVTVQGYLCLRYRCKAVADTTRPANYCLVHAETYDRVCRGCRADAIAVTEEAG